MSCSLRNSISSKFKDGLITFKDLGPSSPFANRVPFFFDITVLLLRFSSWSLMKRVNHPLSVVPGFYFSKFLIKLAEPRLIFPKETLSEPDEPCFFLL